MYTNNGRFFNTNQAALACSWHVMLPYVAWRLLHIAGDVPSEHRISGRRGGRGSADDDDHHYHHHRPSSHYPPACPHHLHDARHSRPNDSSEVQPSESLPMSASVMFATIVFWKTYFRNCIYSLSRRISNYTWLFMTHSEFNDTYNTSQLGIWHYKGSLGRQCSSVRSINLHVFCSVSVDGSVERARRHVGVFDTIDAER